MIRAEEHFALAGHEIVLRCAEEADAERLIDYLKTVTGETPFLLRDPDEVHITPEGERGFIRAHNASEDALLLLAFVDGAFAGNCSFEGKSASRRVKHRAELGIALFQKYTGFGLGRAMLERLLEAMRERGFRQAELTVTEGNDPACHLYERLGFRICGRIPEAYRYGDGSSRDAICMVLPLNVVTGDGSR